VAANSTILPSGDVPSASTVPPALFYIEIGYGDNVCDTYQMPLAFSAGSDADALTAKYPQAVISLLSSPAGPVVLHDATTREDLRQGLLTLIERDATLDLATTRTAALEVAASLAAAATGQSATEELSAGEAAQLLEHPERATHGMAAAGQVHLRPHEEFPAAEPASPEPAMPDSLHEAQVAPRAEVAIPAAPLPISAQPGEAAGAPRSSAPGASSAAERKEPRESPSAGDPAVGAGVLEARASSAFTSDHRSRHLAARVGSAEQSNTSILYGKELILKLFRRLQPGENPDVEIGRFLTEVAQFPRIAPFYGEISITPAGGQRTTVAMLQGLVANQGDGWQWFLDQLSGFYAAVAHLHGPADMPAPGFIPPPEPRHEVREHAAAALDAAALLGRRTAEMHLALATPTDNPAFAAEPFTPEDLSRDARRIEAQIMSALDALKAKLPTFVDLIADDAALLLSRRRDLIRRAHAIEGAQAFGQRIRIHGDYHLGQTLRTAGDSAEDAAGDFVLLDFEGEPARPLIERRQKQSPLKDVAGMVRSFSYAAFSGLDQFMAAEHGGQVSSDALMGWARLWQNSTAAEFLRAYAATMAEQPELLPPPEQAQSLFTAYLLEKALYELLYELNNRPTWLRIPIGGILTM
jgi:maltose alpha-D-glucosyltransferase/alpha-amylase